MLVVELLGDDEDPAVMGIDAPVQAEGLAVRVPAAQPQFDGFHVRKIQDGRYRRSGPARPHELGQGPAVQFPAVVAEHARPGCSEQLKRAAQVHAREQHLGPRVRFARSDTDRQREVGRRPGESRDYNGGHACRIMALAAAIGSLANIPGGADRLGRATVR